MAQKVELIGSIHNIEELDTPAKVIAFLTGDGEDTLIGDLSFVPRMFEPLGLMPGTYQVTGIEGPYFDGYLPGKDLVNGVWVDAPQNDTPWPLEVKSDISAFDLMVAVSHSTANGYPNSNHVFFESVIIDVMAMTIKFNMGS